MIVYIIIPQISSTYIRRVENQRLAKGAYPVAHYALVKWMIGLRRPSLMPRPLCYLEMLDNIISSSLYPAERLILPTVFPMTC